MKIFKFNRAVIYTIATFLLPFAIHAQSLGDDMDSLHGILDQLYDEMMPMCSNLMAVGQGIAGFGAIWYIASRVWRHIANLSLLIFIRFSVLL